MILSVVNIPTSQSPFELSLEAGSSNVFVGANGAGKTRLGVHIENMVNSEKVRRIAAHRSLVITEN